MANKIAPTSKQKSGFLVHLVIFAIVNVLIWMAYKGSMRIDIKGWPYPWPAWITAAWALAVVGHWCSLWTNYEDKGYSKFISETQK